MISKPFLSIAIPFFYRNHNSLKQLYRCIKSIKLQKFNNYEVIISTQNKYEDLKNDHNFKDVSIINAEFIKGFIQGNINNAIRKSNGEWIKIVFSDDFFEDNYAFNKIYQALKNNKNNWALINSLHYSESSNTIFSPLIPYYQKYILELNTIGSPSSLLKRNDGVLFFDEKTWMRLDVDYYFNLYKNYGKPFYIRNVYVINEIHSDQFSSLMKNINKETKKRLNRELNYLCKKYNYKKLKTIEYNFFRITIKIKRILLSILFYLNKNIFVKFFKII